MDSFLVILLPLNISLCAFYGIISLMLPACVNFWVAKFWNTSVLGYSCSVNPSIINRSILPLEHSS